MALAKVVTAPDGTRWRVGRRWLPWQFRRRSLDLADWPWLMDSPVAMADDVIGCLAGGFLALLATVLFFVVILPVVVAAVEAALLVVAVVLGVAARFVFRRPWIVQASRVGHPGRVAWKVVGWRRSGEVVDVIARRLQLGQRDLDIDLPGVKRA
ncbi:MAG TPA: hypothetical protein VM938_00515 [Acidimicrobiales bacterium]|nr:hypothetical protein [Acidimicrobiales bacterium]